MQKKIDSFLSVVMPVYNEEAVIQRVIEDFSGILEKFSRHEFIVVDDGSTDKTLAILREAQKRHPFLSVLRSPRNYGHSRTLLTGLQRAQGDFIFCPDSDNQFYAEDFWVLWNKLKGGSGDIALGYRPKREDPIHRIFVAFLLKVLVFLLFGLHIRDSASSFRLYTKDALRLVLESIPENPFFIFPLMSIVGFVNQLKVYEVPVRHLPRTTGTTYMSYLNIPIICFGAAKELFLFRMGIHRK